MPNGILLTRKTKKELDPAEEYRKLDETLNALPTSIGKVLEADYGISHSDLSTEYADLSRHSIEAQKEQILFRVNERRRQSAIKKNTLVQTYATSLAELSPQEMRAARATINLNGSGSMQAMTLLSRQGNSDRTAWFNSSILTPVAHKLNEEVRALPLHEQFKSALQINPARVKKHGIADVLFTAQNVVQNPGHFNAARHEKELADLHEFGQHLLAQLKAIHDDKSASVEDKKQLSYYFKELSTGKITDSTFEINPKAITWKNGKPEFKIESAGEANTPDHFNTTLGVRTATDNSGRKAVMPLLGGYTFAEPAHLLAGVIQKSKMGIGFERAATLTAKAMLVKNPLKGLESEERRRKKDSDYKSIFAGPGVELPEYTVFHAAEMMQIPETMHIAGFKFQGAEKSIDVIKLRAKLREAGGGSNIAANVKTLLNAIDLKENDDAAAGNLFAKLGLNVRASRGNMDVSKFTPDEIAVLRDMKTSSIITRESRDNKVSQIASLNSAQGFLIQSEFLIPFAPNTTGIFKKGLDWAFGLNEKSQKKMRAHLRPKNIAMYRDTDEDGNVTTRYSEYETFKSVFANRPDTYGVRGTIGYTYDMLGEGMAWTSAKHQLIAEKQSIQKEKIRQINSAETEELKNHAGRTVRDGDVLSFGGQSIRVSIPAPEATIHHVEVTEFGVSDKAGLQHPRYNVSIIYKHSTGPTAHDSEANKLFGAVPNAIVDEISEKLSAKRGANRQVVLDLIGNNPTQNTGVMETTFNMLGRKGYNALVNQYVKSTFATKKEQDSLKRKMKYGVEVSEKNIEHLYSMFSNYVADNTDVVDLDAQVVHASELVQSGAYAHMTADQQALVRKQTGLSEDSEELSAESQSHAPKMFSELELVDEKKGLWSIKKKQIVSTLPTALMATALSYRSGNRKLPYSIVSSAISNFAESPKVQTKVRDYLRGLTGDSQDVLLNIAMAAHNGTRVKGKDRNDSRLGMAILAKTPTIIVNKDGSMVMNVPSGQEDVKGKIHTLSVSDLSGILDQAKAIVGQTDIGGQQLNPKGLEEVYNELVQNHFEDVSGTKVGAVYWADLSKVTVDFKSLNKKSEQAAVTRYRAQDYMGARDEAYQRLVTGAPTKIYGKYEEDAPQNAVTKILDYEAEDSLNRQRDIASPSTNVGTNAYVVGEQSLAPDEVAMSDHDAINMYLAEAKRNGIKMSRKDALAEMMGNQKEFGRAFDTLVFRSPHIDPKSAAIAKVILQSELTGRGSKSIIQAGTALMNALSEMLSGGDFDKDTNNIVGVIGNFLKDTEFTDKTGRKRKIRGGWSPFAGLDSDRYARRGENFEASIANPAGEYQSAKEKRWHLAGGSNSNKLLEEAFSDADQAPQSLVDKVRQGIGSYWKYKLMKDSVAVRSEDISDKNNALSGINKVHIGANFQGNQRMQFMLASMQKEGGGLNIQHLASTVQKFFMASYQSALDAKIDDRGASAFLGLRYDYDGEIKDYSKYSPIQRFQEFVLAAQSGTSAKDVEKLSTNDNANLVAEMIVPVGVEKRDEKVTKYAEMVRRLQTEYWETNKSTIDAPNKNNKIYDTINTEFIKDFGLPADDSMLNAKNNAITGIMLPFVDKYGFDPKIDPSNPSILQKIAERSRRIHSLIRSTNILDPRDVLEAAKSLFEVNPNGTAKEEDLYSHETNSRNGLSYTQNAYDQQMLQIVNRNGGLGGVPPKQDPINSVLPSSNPPNLTGGSGNGSNEPPNTPPAIIPEPNDENENPISNSKFSNVPLSNAPDIEEFEPSAPVAISQPEQQPPALTDLERAQAFLAGGGDDEYEDYEPAPSQPNQSSSSPKTLPGATLGGIADLTPDDSINDFQYRNWPADTQVKGPRKYGGYHQQQGISASRTGSLTEAISSIMQFREPDFEETSDYNLFHGTHKESDSLLEPQQPPILSTLAGQGVKWSPAENIGIQGKGQTSGYSVVSNPGVTLSNRSDDTSSVEGVGIHFYTPEKLEELNNSDFYQSDDYAEKIGLKLAAIKGQNPDIDDSEISYHNIFTSHEDFRQTMHGHDLDGSHREAIDSLFSVSQKGQATGWSGDSVSVYTKSRDAGLHELMGSAVRSMINGIGHSVSGNTFAISNNYADLQPDAVKAVRRVSPLFNVFSPVFARATQIKAAGLAALNPMSRLRNGKGFNLPNHVPGTAGLWGAEPFGVIRNALRLSVAEHWNKMPSNVQSILQELNPSAGNPDTTGFTEDEKMFVGDDAEGKRDQADLLSGMRKSYKGNGSPEDEYEEVDQTQNEVGGEAVGGNATTNNQNGTSNVVSVADRYMDENVRDFRDESEKLSVTSHELATSISSNPQATPYSGAGNDSSPLGTSLPYIQAYLAGHNDLNPVQVSQAVGAQRVANIAQENLNRALGVINRQSGPQWENLNEGMNEAYRTLSAQQAKNGPVSLQDIKREVGKDANGFIRRGMDLMGPNTNPDLVPAIHTVLMARLSGLSAEAGGAGALSGFVNTIRTSDATRSAVNILSDINGEGNDKEYWTQRRNLSIGLAQQSQPGTPEHSGHVADIERYNAQLDTPNEQANALVKAEQSRVASLSTEGRRQAETERVNAANATTISNAQDYTEHIKGLYARTGTTVTEEMEANIRADYLKRNPLELTPDEKDALITNAPKEQNRIQTKKQKQAAQAQKDKESADYKAARQAQQQVKGMSIDQLASTAQSGSTQVQQDAAQARLQVKVGASLDSKTMQQQAPALASQLDHLTKVFDTLAKGAENVTDAHDKLAKQTKLTTGQLEQFHSAAQAIVETVAGARASTDKKQQAIVDTIVPGQKTMTYGQLADQLSATGGIANKSTAGAVQATLGQLPFVETADAKIGKLSFTQKMAAAALPGVEGERLRSQIDEEGGFGTGVQRKAWQVATVANKTASLAVTSHFAIKNIAAAFFTPTFSAATTRGQEEAGYANMLAQVSPGPVGATDQWNYGSQLKNAQAAQQVGFQKMSYNMWSPIMTGAANGLGGLASTVMSIGAPAVGAYEATKTIFDKVGGVGIGAANLEKQTQGAIANGTGIENSVEANKSSLNNMGATAGLFAAGAVIAAGGISAYIGAGQDRTGVIGSIQSQQSGKGDMFDSIRAQAGWSVDDAKGDPWKLLTNTLAPVSRGVTNAGLMYLNSVLPVNYSLIPRKSDAQTAYESNISRTIALSHSGAAPKTAQDAADYASAIYTDTSRKFGDQYDSQAKQASIFATSLAGTALPGTSIDPHDISNQLVNLSKYGIDINQVTSIAQEAFTDKLGAPSSISAAVNGGGINAADRTAKAIEANPKLPAQMQQSGISQLFGQYKAQMASMGYASNADQLNAGLVDLNNPLAILGMNQNVNFALQATSALTSDSYFSRNYSGDIGDGTKGPSGILGDLLGTTNTVSNSLQGIGFSTTGQKTPQQKSIISAAFHSLAQQSAQSEAQFGTAFADNLRGMATANVGANGEFMGGLAGAVSTISGFGLDWHAGIIAPLIKQNAAGINTEQDIQNQLDALGIAPGAGDQQQRDYAANKVIKYGTTKEGEKLGNTVAAMQKVINPRLSSLGLSSMSDTVASDTARIGGVVGIDQQIQTYSQQADYKQLTGATLDISGLSKLATSGSAAGNIATAAALIPQVSQSVIYGGINGNQGAQAINMISNIADPLQRGLAQGMATGDVYATSALATGKVQTNAGGFRTLLATMQDGSNGGTKDVARFTDENMANLSRAELGAISDTSQRLGYTTSTGADIYAGLTGAGSVGAANTRTIPQWQAQMTSEDASYMGKQQAFENKGYGFSQREFSNQYGAIGQSIGAGNLTSSAGIQREQTLFNYAQQGQQLNIQGQQMTLGNEQFQAQWQLGAQELATSSSYQLNEMNVGQQHHVQEAKWQQQDIAFQQNKSQMDFGFSMIQSDEDIRFSTGRQRRDLMRNRQQAVLDQSMNMNQSDKEMGRAKQRETWDTEAYNRQVTYFKTNLDYQLQAQAQSKKFHDEGYALEQKNFELTKKNYAMQGVWMQAQNALEEKAKVLAGERLILQGEEIKASQTHATIVTEINKNISVLNGSVQLGTTYYDAAVKSGTIFNTMFQQLGATLFPQATAALQAMITMLSGMSAQMAQNASQASVGITNNPGTNYSIPGKHYSMASGGYTGNAPTNQAVGIVHGQEYVIPAPGAPVVMAPAMQDTLTKILKELMGIHSDGGNAVINIHNNTSSAPAQGLSLYEKALKQ